MMYGCLLPPRPPRFTGAELDVPQLSLVSARAAMGSGGVPALQAMLCPADTAMLVAFVESVTPLVAAAWTGDDTPAATAAVLCECADDATTKLPCMYGYCGPWTLYVGSIGGAAADALDAMTAVADAGAIH